MTKQDIIENFTNGVYNGKIELLVLDLDEVNGCKDSIMGIGTHSDGFKEGYNAGLQEGVREGIDAVEKESDE